LGVIQGFNPGPLSGYIGSIDGGFQWLPTTSELSKVNGLGEARAKKIKKMLDTKSKFLKKSNQKTLHD